MCLILFSWQQHSIYSLAFAANRDEYHARATAPAAFWEDEPSVLAGRDLKAGGTWLGITTDGRFAALTNFRAPRDARAGAPSRGALVGDYLRGRMSPDDYLAGVQVRASAYNGFNLLVGRLGGDPELHWYSNLDGAAKAIAPGVHGVSNHLLDTPWPKVTRGKNALAALLDGGERLSPDTLLDLLADGSSAPDDTLPDTGVGLELERALSPLFIDAGSYGTRSSTVILVERGGRVHFVERSFAPGRRATGTVTYALELPAAAKAGRDVARSA